jgi:two-component system phosphate regulon response regulator PhoB
MARVLLAADGTDAARLHDHLRFVGHQVTFADNGRDAMAACVRDACNLVIIDMVSAGGGIDLCRAIRSHRAVRDVPIIVVSERSDEIDRVVGFEVGADDYVTKPFSERELALRVRAVLRRRRRGARVATVSHMGGFEFDASANSVYVNGVRISLSALEYQLLASLSQRPDRVHSRRDLLTEVWKGADGISERTVDVCIKRLRYKLGVAGACIQTVRGIGYRFVALAPGAVKSSG